MTDEGKDVKKDRDRDRDARHRENRRKGKKEERKGKRGREGEDQGIISARVQTARASTVILLVSEGFLHHPYLPFS